MGVGVAVVLVGSRKTTNRLRAIETTDLNTARVARGPCRKTTNRLRAIETDGHAHQARLALLVARQLIAFGRLKP